MTPPLDLEATRKRHEATKAEIQNNFGAAYSSRITDSYQIHCDRGSLIDALRDARNAALEEAADAVARCNKPGMADYIRSLKSPPQ